MKKTFTRFLAALMLLAIFTPSFKAMGQTYTTVMECDMTTKAYGCSAYNTSTAYGDWTIVNGANNNKGWAYFKMGGKSATISNYNPCYIYSTTAATSSVDKITVHLPAGSLSKPGMSVNSWGVYVYSNSAMTTQIDYVAGGTITNSEGSFDFTPTTGVTWASGYYYKVSWDLANTTTTNGIVCVDKITLYKETSATATTTTIDATGITNTDVYTSTAAGSLSATVTADGSALSGATVTWSGNNDAVATIDASTGVVTLVAAGNVTFTATYAGVSGTYLASSATYTLNVTDSTPFAGGDVTFVAGTDVGTTSATGPDSMTKAVVTISSTSAAFATAEYRIYSGSTTTISTSEGTITSIEFTVTGSYSLSNLSTEIGTYSSATGIWTGNASSVAFSASAQVRLKEITVTVDVSGTPDPELDADDVELTYDATSGEIAYTLNNPVENGSLSVSDNVDWISNPTLSTTESKVTFTTTANETTTSRVGIITITYTYGNDSVSKDVTVTQAAAPVIYTTIPALFNAATSTATDVNITFGGWVVSAVKGSNAYLTDNQGNGLIIYASNHGFQVNNVLTGTVSCKLQTYRGSAELTNLTSSTEGLTVTSNGTVTEQTIAINALTGVNTGALLAYQSLTYNGTALVDDNNNTITPYSTLYSYTFENGKTYNVKGIYLQFNNTKEILPRSAADIEKVETFTLDIDQYTSGQNNGWYLIASPVSVDIESNTMISGTYDLYRFNPTATGAEWENYKNTEHSDFTTLEVGRGYLYANGNNGGIQLSFTGTPADNGEVTTAYNGWNLIGNPLSTAAIVDKDYYRMNDTRTGIMTTSSSDNVAKMEGIFVQAEEGETVTFTAASKGERSNSTESVVLNIMQDGKVIDRAIVRFNSDRQMLKFQLFQGSTKIYFPMEDADYAIVSSNGQGNMPVNFKAARTGEYTLSVETEGIDMNYMHIIDRLTGEDINVLLDNEYSFIASQSDVADRFILSFNENGYNAEANETFAFQNGSDIIVNGNGTLQVFDVTGRMVMNTQVNGVQTVNMPNGVYVFRMIGETVNTQKIVVR